MKTNPNDWKSNKASYTPRQGIQKVDDLYIVMVVDDCLFIFKFELFVFGGAILMVSVGDPPMRFHKGFSEFPVLDFQVLIMNSWNS